MHACSSSSEHGAIAHAARSRPGGFSEAWRSRHRERCGDPARKLARRPSAKRGADRGAACGSLVFCARRRPVRRGAVRRRRLAHAHRRPSPATATRARRSSRTRATRRNGRRPARTSAAHRAEIRRRSRCRVGRHSAGMAARFSMRTSIERSHCGTYGRRLPPFRSPSSRRRRASRSTGDSSAHCVGAAWSSPPSRWRQASRRREIPRSTRACRSTSLIAFSGEHRFGHSSRKGETAGASSRWGRQSFARWSIPAAVPEKAWPTSASAGHAPACRRCDPFRDARSPREPLSVAARVPTRRRARSRPGGAGGFELSHSRVRRFGSDFRPITGIHGRLRQGRSRRQRPVRWYRQAATTRELEAVDRAAPTIRSTFAATASTQPRWQRLCARHAFAKPPSSRASVRPTRVS